MNINSENLQNVTGLIPGQRIVIVDGVALPVGPCNITVDPEMVNGDLVIETGEDFTNPCYHNWYRKYRSGWVEQGGTTTDIVPPGGVDRIVFPLPMADKYYCFCMGFESTDNGMAGYADFSIYGRDAESIYYYPVTQKREAVSWMVWGMAAPGNSNGGNGE